MVKKLCLVMTAKPIPYTDIDEVDRVIPVGTVGVVESVNLKLREASVRFGDHSFEFDLNQEEVEIDDWCRRSR